MTTGTASDAHTAIGDVEHEFGLIFNRVRGLMRDRAEQVHPDLQPLGYKVLTTLVRSGRLHAGAIGELLMTDKSTISRTVKQLEELGLVVREADPADGRATYLAASEDGARRVEWIRADGMERWRSRLGEWETADLTRLAELLAKLNESI
ncbi:DNA-binding MarR family transcriptional regulator [Mycetocola sp. CAN_C7]|uniref:MarR family winged helix-turn-helix transcriptional regulator n=1 Tax=Mycetocola sp. CAN_C7 TaxID=2787724 RepID=UPI0018C9E37B